MNKKEYQTPEMTVLDMKFQGYLLSASGNDGPDGFNESDDEFGFNYSPDSSRQA